MDWGAIMEKKLVWFLSGVGGFLLSLWVRAPQVVQVLVVVTVLHLLAYIVERAVTDRVDVEDLAEWIGRRVMMFILLGVVYVVAADGAGAVGVGGELFGIVAGFYVVQEALGVMQRAIHMGLPVPDALRRVFSPPQSEKAGDQEGADR